MATKKHSVFIPEGSKPQSIRVGRGEKNVEFGKGYSPPGTFGHIDKEKTKGPIVWLEGFFKKKRKQNEKDGN